MVGAARHPTHDEAVNSLGLMRAQLHALHVVS